MNIEKKLANPFIAGSRGFIDDVIMPNTTRKRICRSLEMLKNKKLKNPGKNTIIFLYKNNVQKNFNS